MPGRKPKPDEKPQRERFIEAAREIGANENPDAFEKAFKLVVKNSMLIKALKKAG